MRRRRSRETTGRERSRLFFCCCCRVRALHQFDATAAGMNLKQFNFYSTRRVNLSFGRKKTAWLGRKRLQKRREKEKKRNERGRIFCDTSAHHNKNVPSRRRIVVQKKKRDKVLQRERENFFILLRRRKGEKEDKRESACPFPFLFREREERDSFVVVVSLTSFTSSSPGHHP